MLMVDIRRFVSFLQVRKVNRDLSEQVVLLACLVEPDLLEIGVLMVFQALTAS